MFLFVRNRQPPTTIVVVYIPCVYFTPLFRTKGKVSHMIQASIYGDSEEYLYTNNAAKQHNKCGFGKQLIMINGILYYQSSYSCESKKAVTDQDLDTKH